MAAFLFLLQQANSIRGKDHPMLILISPGVTKLKVDPYYVLRSSPRGPVVFVLFYHIAFHLRAAIPVNAGNGAHRTSQGQRLTTLPGILIADDCVRAQLVFTRFTL